MTTLGKIEEFDVRGGKIDRYLERLEQCLRLPAEDARF